jgi:hypothetical protein
MPIGPDKWGVHGWKFIHHVALGYPKIPDENNKNNYKSFFSLLGTVLPCHICNDHYNEHLLIHPLTDDVLSTTRKLINWTIDMHNEVNKAHGKKIYGYDEAFELILNNYETPNKITNNTSYNNTNNTNNTNNITDTNNNKQIKNKKETNNNMLYIGIIIFLILVIIAILCKKKRTNFLIE